MGYEKLSDEVDLESIMTTFDSLPTVSSGATGKTEPVFPPVSRGATGKTEPVASPADDVRQVNQEAELERVIASMQEMGMDKLPSFDSQNFAPPDELDRQIKQEEPVETGRPGPQGSWSPWFEFMRKADTHLPSPEPEMRA